MRISEVQNTLPDGKCEYESALKMVEVLQSLKSQSKTRPEVKETLLRTLDDLLERYLNLLHDHQFQQSEMSEHLSSVCTIC